MNFLISNWYIIVAIIAVIVVICGLVYKFVLSPSDVQLGKVREWLLWAVTEAEKELGSGTGQIKLRYVYELFLNRFSWISKLISFDTFSALVDEALDKFKTLLSTNANLQDYVYGEDEEGE